MSAFKGYTIKLGGNILPGKFILADSYKAVINKLEEAWRDGNQDLHRDVINQKITCGFTVPSLHQEEFEEFMSLIDAALILAVEDKVTIECWVPRLRTYRTFTAYMPDIEFTVRRHTEDDVVYQDKEIIFIEY